MSDWDRLSSLWGTPYSCSRPLPGRGVTSRCMPSSGPRKGTSTWKLPRGGDTFRCIPSSGSWNAVYVTRRNNSRQLPAVIFTHSLANSTWRLARPSMAATHWVLPRSVVYPAYTSTSSLVTFSAICVTVSFARSCRRYQRRNGSSSNSGSKKP